MSFAWSANAAGTPTGRSRSGVLLSVDRLLGTLDLTLDLTHTVEILIQAHAIGNAHALLEPGDVLGERIEQACSIAQRGAARVRIAALAEQALEDDSRMRLGRKRGRRRRP